MAASRQRFYEVVTDAVNDFLEHGFDSQERLDYWLRRLEEAARAALVPETQLAQTLSGALNQVFRRVTKPRAMAKIRPGAEPFTIDMIKPKLRAELDRRILASANLIKLNREASVARTLQRFAGWASSVPKGGTEVAKRQQVKETVRRGISGLPFEERRVITDQGHKLVAAIDEIVAVDGGAIAAVWHHVMEGGGYQARPKHEARDGDVFLLRDSWADKQGLVKLDGRMYTDQVEQPAEEINCLPGDSKIQFADGVGVGYRRWYSGDLTEIVTDSGKTIRATPNHPVLTMRGWIGAGALNESDYVVEICNEGIDGIVPKTNRNEAVPTLSEVFSSLNEPFKVTQVPASRNQFHGDGSGDGNVNTVFAARPLTFDVISPSLHLRQKFSFAVSLNKFALGCAAFQFLRRGLSALSRFVRGTSASGVLFRRFVLRDNLVCEAPSARCTARFNDMASDNATTHVERFSQRKYTFALLMRVTQSPSVKNYLRTFRDLLTKVNFTRQVPGPQAHDRYVKDVRDFLDTASFRTQFSRVVKVNRQFWSSHVYNLETANGWYVANGIVTHNCRCRYQYLYSLRDLPPSMVTAKGRAWLNAAAAKLRKVK